MFKTKKGALVPKTTSSKSKSNRKAHEHAVPEPGIPVTVAAELLVELITGLDWRIMEEMFSIWIMKEGEFNKGDYPTANTIAMLPDPCWLSRTRTKA